MPAKLCRFSLVVTALLLLNAATTASMDLEEGLTKHLLVSPPKDKGNAVFMSFLLFGFLTMAPTSAFFNTDFFDVAFAESPFAHSYATWYAWITVICSTIWQFIASRNSFDNIFFVKLSFIIKGITMFLMSMVVWISAHLPPTVMFGIGMVAIAVSGVANGMLLSSSNGLSFRFPTTIIYSRNVGRSLANVVFSAQYTISTLTTKQPPSPAKNQTTNSQISIQDKIAPFSTFISCSALSFFALITVYLLQGYSAYFNHVLAGHAETVSSTNHESTNPCHIHESAKSSHSLSPSLRGMFVSHFITSTCFATIYPFFLKHIVSDGKLGDDLIPIAFLLFSSTDFLGRLATYCPLLPLPPALSLLLSISRFSIVVFVFMLFNFKKTEAVDNKDPFPNALRLIRSDAAYLSIVIATGLTGGYLMQWNLVESSKHARNTNEKERIGTVLAFIGSLGAVAGALLQFALQGILCSCNPFLY